MFAKIATFCLLAVLFQLSAGAPQPPSAGVGVGSSANAAQANTLFGFPGIGLGGFPGYNPIYGPGISTYPSYPSLYPGVGGYPPFGGAFGGPFGGVPSLGGLGTTYPYF